jgi:hypothetical protein
LLVGKHGKELRVLLPYARGPSFVVVEEMVEGSHDMRCDLTRHKISYREPGNAWYAAKGRTESTPKVERSAARGSLHRLVRRKHANNSSAIYHFHLFHQQVT